MLFFAGEAHAAVGGEGISVGDVIEKTEVIMQIAAHKLSPWKPAWHVLQRADPPDGELPTSSSRMYTEATGMGKSVSIKWYGTQVSLEAVS